MFPYLEYLGHPPVRQCSGEALIDHLGPSVSFQAGYPALKLVFWDFKGRSHRVTLGPKWIPNRRRRMPTSRPKRRRRRSLSVWFAWTSSFSPFRLWNSKAASIFGVFWACGSTASKAKMSGRFSACFRLVQCSHRRGLPFLLFVFPAVGLIA